MHNSRLFHQEINQLVENYEKICSLDPDTPENWQMLGRCLVDAERFDDAGRVLDIFFEKGRFFSIKKGLPRIRLGALRHYKRNRILFAKAYTDLGAVALNDGDLATAQRLLLLAMREFEREKMDAEYIRAAHVLGTVYRISGNFDSAAEIFRNTQKTAAEHHWPFQQAAALGNRGLVAFSCELFADAQSFHEQADILYTQNGWMQEAAWQRRSAAVAALCLNNREKAFQNLTDALHLFQQHGNLTYQARLLSDLAMAYHQFEENDNALNAAQQALDTAVASADEAQIAENRFELARLKCAFLQTCDDIVSLLKQSADYYRKQEQKAALSDVLSTLGLYYLNTGRLKKAESCFKESLRLEQILCRRFGEARDYANLGLVFEKKGQTERACSYYEKARFLFETEGNLPLTADMTQKLDELANARYGAAEDGNNASSATVG